MAMVLSLPLAIPCLASRVVVVPIPCLASCVVVVPIVVEGDPRSGEVGYDQELS